MGVARQGYRRSGEPAKTRDDGALRILYANEALHNAARGPAAHGWELVRALIAEGHQVDIHPRSATRYAATKGIGRLTALRFTPALKSVVGEERGKLVRGLIRTFARCMSLAGATAADPPDVVLGRHVGYDWTPWLAARLLRRPLVLEVNAPLSMERRLVGGRESLSLRWMEEFQWRRATLVQVVSTELAKIVASAGVSEDRIAVVPNGADPECWPGSPAGSRPVEDFLRVGFIGGFYAWHGVGDLLQAVAIARDRIPNVRLELVGAGPELSRMEDAVRTLNIGDHVVFHGAVARDRVPSLLATWNIAVAPYPRLDPFYFSPLKIYEYMAAGAAIVASGQGQILDVLENERTALLYSPGDVSALALAIERLGEASELRARLGEAARRRLILEHTWVQTARRLATVCARAARANGDRTGWKAGIVP